MSTPIFELCNEPHDALLARIRENLAPLAALQQEMEVAEPLGLMRFYNSDLGVYRLWPMVERAAALFRAISPSGEMALQFEIMVQDAAEARLDRRSPRAWIMAAQPMVTILHHCRFLVDEHVRAGQELERAPDVPSAGWAALLGLYRLY